MIPLKLNKQQLEAYKNGATMFIVPIVHPCEYYSSRKQQAIRIETASDPWYKDRNYCIRDEGGAWQDFTKEHFLEYVKCPLKKGDRFFIQEEFTEDEILLGGDEILYKNDFMPRDFKNEAIGYGLTTDHMKERILIRCNWIDASQMQEHQSRFRDIDCLNVEIKRVQDLVAIDGYFMDYVNSLASKTYENNPYVFLITVKGIQ